MLFGPRHDILLLAQIPRERTLLQSMLVEARRQRRRSRLTRFAAYNCIAWALIILLLWMPLHSAPARAPAHVERPIHQHVISSHY